MTDPAAELDERSLAAHTVAVAASDPRLAVLVGRNGVPPLWARGPGFATLVKLILEQQVSLASAAAAFANLEAALGEVTPSAFLGLGDVELREVGFSRQKAGYCRGLARALDAGSLDLEGLGALDDEPARAVLEGVRGIGAWTSACYLLFVLLRPDAWPSGDRALHVSMGRALGLPAAPTSPEADEIATRWRPHRAVAARLLWFDYLGGPAGVGVPRRSVPEGRR